nr:MAG: hypothetical protein [Caudoviricetes sp.]
MDIYTHKNYRKIWEHFNGPIPTDENGRTYEIHHIDGNRNNNNLENLVAVSIDEHYDIHFSQGDYLACSLIEFRRNQSPELISFLRSESAKKLVEEGRHPFQTRPDGSSVSKENTEKRVKNGTHHFLTRPDGSSVSKENTEKRVKEGTHNFLTRPDGTNLQTNRVNAGTHHLLTRPDGTNLNTDRVKEGTHHLLKRPDGSSVGKESNEKRVKEGTHHLLKRPDGSSVSKESNEKRVKEGTHNFLMIKGLVPCYNKSGEYKRIPKEQYYSQTGSMEDWEWVFNTSKEGGKRKNTIIPKLNNK